MNILFYSTFFHPYVSGMTTYTFDIMKNLSQSNNVTVLTFPHQPNLSFHEKINKINIIRIPYLFRLSKGFISPQSLYYFFIESKHSDRIILNIPNFEALLLAIIAKCMKKKIISIFNCEVYVGKGILARIIQFFLDSSVYIQLQLSDTIIAHTRDYFENLSFRKRIYKKTTYIFPHIRKPVIDKDYLNTLLTQKEQSIWIGFFGRISREKGIEYLIKALTEVSKKNPHICLIIAGPTKEQTVGENKYHTHINTLLDSLNIRVIKLGNISDKQKGAFYSSLDMLVLPSINKTESFGIVQVESMLCATPVIASDLPGVRIPVLKTGMGLLSNPQDSVHLAIQIENIITNAKVYKKKIKSAQQVFSQITIINAYRRKLLE